jgi:UDP-glucose 4-epimerase
VAQRNTEDKAELMKIAITGATGVIGRAVVAELAGHQLLLLGRNAERMQQQFPSASTRETDYSAEDLASALRDSNALVHLAAARPAASLTSFDDFYMGNVRTTENLFKACVDAGISNVVLASTASVYSPKFNQIPFDEDQVVFPRSFYGISKLTCEKLAYKYGLNAKSLRITHVISIHEKDGYMLRTFIDRALAGERLTVFGQGSGAREYVYVRDVASAVGAALRAESARGVFNIGMGAVTTHRELAQTISEKLGGGQSTVALDPTKPDDPEGHLMTSEKARAELGWKARFDIAATFVDIANQLRS